MKRIVNGIFIVALAVVLAVGMIGCAKQAPPEETEEKATMKPLNEAEPIDFQSIKVTDAGTRSYSTGYLAERTGSGVHLEYYIFRKGYDEATGENVDETRMIHSYDGDESVYHKLALLVGSAPLESWEGVKGEETSENAGFSMELNLADGQKVSLSGEKKYPDGYRNFVNILDEVCSSELVTDTSFDAGDYKLTLPESWKDNVYAIYRDGRYAFEVRGKKQSQMLLSFYEGAYHSSGNMSAYTTLVSFLKDGDIYFVKMRKMFDEKTDLGKLSSKHKKICASLEADMKKIAASISMDGSFEQVDEPETEGSQDSAEYITGNSNYDSEYNNPYPYDTDDTNPEDTDDADTPNEDTDTDSGDDSDSGEDSAPEDSGDDSGDAGDDGAEDSADDGAYDEPAPEPDDGGGDDEGGDTDG